MTVYESPLDSFFGLWESILFYKLTTHCDSIALRTDRRGSCAMLQRDARDLRTDREVRETLSETYTTFSTMGANCPIGGVPKSLAFSFS